MGKFIVLAASSLSALTLAAAAGLAADATVAPVSGYMPYVSIFGGASFLNNVNTVSSGAAPYSVKTDTGYLIGGAIGLKWNEMLRTEIELSHMSNNANSYNKNGAPFSPASGPIRQTYLLGNVWLDIPTGSSFTPYAGGGLGVGFADADVTFNGGIAGYGSRTSGASFAYQLGGGIKFSLSEKIDLDLGYRYKGMTNVNFTDNQSNNYEFNGANLNSHNVQLGLTFNF